MLHSCVYVRVCVRYLSSLLGLRLRLRLRFPPGDEFLVSSLRSRRSLSGDLERGRRSRSRSRSRTLSLSRLPFSVERERERDLLLDLRRSAKQIVYRKTCHEKTTQRNAEKKMLKGILKI